jgi:uncharacterized protein (DUF2062 family)
MDSQCLFAVSSFNSDKISKMRTNLIFDIEITTEFLIGAIVVTVVVILLTIIMGRKYLASRRRRRQLKSAEQIKN